MGDCYFSHCIDEVKGRCNLFLASWLENAKLQILKAHKDGKAAEHFILEQGRCFLCPFAPAVVSPLSKCSKPHIKGCTSHIFLSFAFWLFYYFIYLLFLALCAGVLKFCEQLYLGTVFLVWFLWQSPWQKRLEGGVCFGSEFESTFYHGGRGLRHWVALQWGSRKTSEKFASLPPFCFVWEPSPWDGAAHI